jgi:hypothetical protein
MQMAQHICMILLCHLYDFPFLGMICHGLYNFCLLACFQWNLFGRPIFKFGFFLHISILFLDALPMMVFVLSNFG